MKVLFVSSGNQRVGIVSPFVQSQYNSLKAEGVEMALFPIKGRGWHGYLKAVFALRRVVKQACPDIIHAHYSLCGWVSTLACLGLRKKPKIVVSILGSFPKKGNRWKMVRWSIKHLWNATIVKSQRTANQLELPVNIIPNGVNLEVFRTIDNAEARKIVGFEKNKKYVIWCSNPERPEKNWPLAVEGVRELKKEGFSAELVAVYNKTPREVCTYMNAADCLLLTSDSEGSPNVIKEAMACNCPIVTTNVGDVEERLKDIEGCYIIQDKDCRFTDKQKAAKLTARELSKALTFEKRTNGRQRIMDDKLEISQIAKRIKEIYDNI